MNFTVNPIIFTYTVERKDTLRLYSKSTVGWRMLSKVPYAVIANTVSGYHDHASEAD